MAIYVGTNVLDLNTIKIPTERGDLEYYRGQDEVKTLFAGAWKELDQRFFNHNQPVVFKTPGIKSGAGKGNQGYAYPRVVDYKTKKGKVRIAWADSISVENGKTVYAPVMRSIGVNEKTLTLTQEDIEEVLFMYLFNPSLLTPKNPMGRTYLEDKEADAKKYEETETGAAVISYWIFRKESPFYSNDSKIDTLCLYWGISPAGKSITYKKQLLAEAVKRAEKRNELEFNLKALNDICERLKDGQDTRDVEVMALIQRAITSKVIRFDPEKIAWTLLGIEGNTLKTLCKVPPQLIAVNRQVIKKHLLESPDDVSTIESALSIEPTPSRLDRCRLIDPLPDDVTEDYILNTMKWNDKKVIYKFMGHEQMGATLEQVNPVLIEYFALNHRTIPWELKQK